MCNGKKITEDKKNGAPVVSDNDKPTIKPGRTINEDGKAIEDSKKIED